MNPDILILGADGQQGTIATRFLRQRGYRLACADIYEENFRRENHGKGVPFTFCDHRDKKQIAKLMLRHKPKVILNCANDFYNDNVLDVCVAQGVHCIDFGSDIPGTKRRLERDQELRDAGITLIMGCGSVPGIGSVMLRKLSEQFERMDYAEAGFAWESSTPDFVPPFFLYVVTLELSLPAYVMVNGDLTTIPPMSKSKCIGLPLLGAQEVYKVSHSEVFSFHHYFKDKGLKDVSFYAGFPQHSKEVILSLIRLGLNHEEAVNVVTEKGNVSVTPCDFLTAAAKKIQSPEGYTEQEVLWATVAGVTKGNETNRPPNLNTTMYCKVPVIKGWERYGCNVDTAFPGSVITEMVLDGRIKARGAFCPEGIVNPELFLPEMTKLGFEFTVK